MKKTILLLTIFMFSYSFGFSSKINEKKLISAPHCDYTIYYNGKIIGTGHVDGMWCNEFFLEGVFYGTMRYI